MNVLTRDKQIDIIAALTSDSDDAESHYTRRKWSLALSHGVGGTAS